MTDPIADLLVRIQNGAKRGHETVTAPASKLKAEVLRVLKTEGFISGYEQFVMNGYPTLRVQLRYVGDGQPIISAMRRVSRPGKRVYVSRRESTQVRGGIGISILSTSKGVMTDQASRRLNLGGEVLCQVW
jgi:small subunit ribosomal protein S8